MISSKNYCNNTDREGKLIFKSAIIYDGCYLLQLRKEVRTKNSRKWKKIHHFMIMYPVSLLKETVFLFFSTKRSRKDPVLMALNIVSLTF